MVLKHPMTRRAALEGAAATGLAASLVAFGPSAARAQGAPAVLGITKLPVSGYFRGLWAGARWTVRQHASSA